jgi:hypothetical protein
MKKLKKTFLVTFLMGSMITMALLTQGQPPIKFASANSYVNILPYINAGPDAAICDGSDFTTQGLVPLEGTSYWISDGDGTFDNPFNPTATYTPGNMDIYAGLVTLTLYFIPMGSNQSTMHDEMILYLNTCINIKPNEQ